jgi:phage tail sheath gpL-like
VERRDYLLRMLEEMGRVLARVRELIIGQSVAAAAQELERAAARAGLTLPLVHALTGDGLAAILTTAGRLDPAKHLLAAEYLYVEGLRAAPPDDAALHGRALALYRGIGPLRDAALQAAVADRITDLERRVAAPPSPLSGGTLR